MLSRQALALGRRNASAFAATTLAAPEEKISRLPNGLTVASVDLEGALSQLVLAFRAGSRYESRDEAGLVHHIRNAVGKDSTGFTGINLLWTTGSIGAQLTATATRDVLAVRVATSRDRAGVALSLLGHLGAQPAFKPWELEDVSETLVEDNKNATAHERLIEALHSAAFRSGNLANSVLAAPDSVGKHNYKAFQAYANRRLVSGEAVLVGVNVDHSLLLEYATQQAPINEGRGGNAEASPYIGGESRVEAGGKVAYVAIAGAGASLADSQGVATQAVLSQAIGESATLRYGSPSAGTVAKAAFKAGALGVSAVNELHSDAGLAGVYLVGNASNIGGAVTAAASALKSLRVDDAALGAAKARAQVAVQTRAESGSVLALDRAIQIAATGAAVSPADFASQISQVKAADVNKAIEKLASKLSIASYGAVANVPYRDQL